MKNETDACMFLLMITPQWPASVVFCREAWSDSMCGVRGGKGERSLRVAVTKCECRNEEEKEEEGVVRLSPTHAPRPQTLKKKSENICTNDETHSTDLQLKDNIQDLHVVKNV